MLPLIVWVLVKPRRRRGGGSPGGLTQGQTGLERRSRTPMWPGGLYVLGGGLGSLGLLPIATTGPRRRNQSGYVRACLGRSCND